LPEDFDADDETFTESFFKCKAVKSLKKAQASLRKSGLVTNNEDCNSATHLSKAISDMISNFN
jgi:hypothetical protein